MQEPLDPHLSTPSGKPRARSLGIPFAGTPGRYNAITDVSGVEVGYSTLIEGDSVRTGVTAIHPRGRRGRGACAAGFHCQNGNGEMTGISWIEESGTASGPVALSNTHAVGMAHAALVSWTSMHDLLPTEGWVLPVVAETWDGYLNDINGGHVTIDVVHEALESATSGSVEEGSVGGGTGMSCYGFKGGTGTASRLVDYGGSTYTMGVLVQANFGSRRELTISGVPLGAALAGDNPMEGFFSAAGGAGSIVAIVATDAPLLPNQCKALARRVTLGVARTGTSGSHYSGDLFLTVSTANAGAFSNAFGPLFEDYEERLHDLTFIPWGFLDRFFEAVVQAVEEAVVNALVANEEMHGFGGRRVPGLPREQVVELLQARGVIT